MKTLLLCLTFLILALGAGCTAGAGSLDNPDRAVTEGNGLDPHGGRATSDGRGIDPNGRETSQGSMIDPDGARHTSLKAQWMD